MPAVDDARRRLLLAPRHVRALVHLSSGTPAEQLEAEEPGAVGEVLEDGLDAVKESKANPGNWF